MNLALWIVAGLLAVVMLGGGISKLFVPKEKLAAAPAGGWTGDASVGFVKTLGAVEILAAVGVLLPAAVDIAPVLVPVTAVCWVLLMIGAMITHLRRHESVAVVANLVYLAMAVFVAWGRFGPESFTG
ncbi:MAG: DoxX family protein [Actinomadura sp.]